MHDNLFRNRFRTRITYHICALLIPMKNMTTMTQTCSRTSPVLTTGACPERNLSETQLEQMCAVALTYEKHVETIQTKITHAFAENNYILNRLPEKDRTPETPEEKNQHMLLRRTLDRFIEDPSKSVHAKMETMKTPANESHETRLLHAEKHEILLSAIQSATDELKANSKAMWVELMAIAGKRDFTQAVVQKELLEYVRANGQKIDSLRETIESNYRDTQATLHELAGTVANHAATAEANHHVTQTTLHELAGTVANHAATAETNHRDTQATLHTFLTDIKGTATEHQAALKDLKGTAKEQQTASDANHRTTHAALNTLAEAAAEHKANTLLRNIGWALWCVSTVGYMVVTGGN
jgi:hypothetical protein